MVKVKEQVKAGAELLDKEMPGWYKEIDTKKLDTDSVFRCVLGQLYGEFDNGIFALDLNRYLGRRKAADFGFDPGRNKSEKTDKRWTKEIERRLAA